MAEIIEVRLRGDGVCTHPRSPADKYGTLPRAKPKPTKGYSSKGSLLVFHKTHDFLFSRGRRQFNR